VALVPAVFRGRDSRHTHATLLTEVGESIKTAQALLGHSDLGTTLNTYGHVIPDSQRRAVERVAEVLFSNVLETEENAQSGKTNCLQKQDLENSWWAR
jgi:integrase